MTTVHPAPINRDKSVNVTNMKEEIKRLKTIVDAQGREIAELKAAAVRSVAENKRLGDINNELVKENNVLRAVSERSTGAPALGTLEKSLYGTEDKERLVGGDEEELGKEEDIVRNMGDDIEMGRVEPQGDGEEGLTTSRGTVSQDSVPKDHPKIMNNDEIDKEALMALANIIENEPQNYTDEEERAIKEGKEFYMKCKATKTFKNMKSPDPRVKLKGVHLEGESLVTGMTETVVDASLAVCVAYEFIKDSRERKAKLGKKYKAIETKKLNGHSQLYLNRRKLGQGLSLREWRVFGTWQTEKGGTKCWTVYKDTNLLDNHFSLLSSRTVLASVTTTWLFEALPTDKGTPQCRVTFASRVDIKSSVPTFVMNYLSSNYTKNIIDIRNKFAKTDDEKDSITRELLAKVIENEKQTYTEEEEKAIRSAKEFYKKCKEGTGAYELKSPDEKVEMKGVH
ncbi:hypothetical protein TrCOL_g12206, partial [Triparma columacea]